MYIVKKNNSATSFHAIVLLLLTELPVYLCGETGAPGVSTENLIHRPLLHRCCSVVVHNSLMIWLAGQARQRHSAIITDGEAVCAKQTHVDIEIYVEPSCSIHLNRGNILRVVLTSFNHGGNWCIFFAATRKLKGRGFCQCAFFPPHCCFFLSPPATCCSGRQLAAQTRGRKRREESKRNGKMLWERQGTGRNPEKNRQRERSRDSKMIEGRENWS